MADTTGAETRAAVAAAPAKGGGKRGLPPALERGLDRALKPLAWALCLLPLALIVHDMFTDGLGAEPIEELTHRTGKTALVLLMVTLAVTPVRRILRWNGVVRARRMLGLFAFFYAFLHFGVYLFDQGLIVDPGFQWAYVIEDVAERPYVTAGFTALVLMVPLAATSTRSAIRKLGKRWQKLHRLVYLVAGLGVLHFLWLVKQDLREPLIFAGVLAFLMLFRLPLGGARKTRTGPREGGTRRPTPPSDQKSAAGEQA